MSRALGVDLGERRIGLALSDPLGITVSPHGVVERGGDREADHLAVVDAAVTAEAATIVVGMPLSLDGRRGPAARAAAADIESLRALAGPAGIAVVAHDERFTTRTAQAVLASAGVKARRRRTVVDQVAAAVLLQSWLDAGQP